MTFTSGVPSKPFPQEQIQSKTVTELDAIYNKTLVPIPTGGMATGYLLVNFAGISKEELFTPFTILSIRCQDVMGHLVRTIYIFRESDKPVGHAHLGG
jgi:hypothetical protein